MATTSPDNIWTPNSSEDYDYVIDAAATATSVQNALTKRANSYTGTTTQRDAFTSAAPEGSLWSDTNGDKILWIKQGASWQRVWPQPPQPRVLSGSVLMVAVANQVTQVSVTFPQGYFTQTPNVVATAWTSAPGVVQEVSVLNLSTTGVTICGYRTSSTDYSVQWIACQNDT